MSDQPFDLKLVPDWLKDAPAKNPYADFQGDREDRPRRDFSDRGPRPPRRDDRPGGSRPGGPRRDDRGPSRPPGAGRSDRRETGPQRGPGDDRPRHQEPPREPKPLAVTVEFLPEPAVLSGLANHIRNGALAYPLLGLARMFLEKPERHRVKITSTDPAAPLWQCGENGPVALDRRAIEENAFRLLREKFYTTETIQRDPPKGNFASVARCRLTGDLLGPTNHHGYQLAMRRLYEDRFSRRMSFPDFQREIENVTDPAVVEKWKEQTSTVTVHKTTREPEEKTFETEADAEAHFRKHHLEAEIHSGTEFVLTGEASRVLPDPRLRNAVRNAWENERGFPGQLMGRISRLMIDERLLIFKHSKRMLFLTPIRPQPFKPGGQTLSENVAAILNTLDARPKCKRAALAATLLEGIADETEKEKRKSALASDLHWLIQAGRVIEFHDGTLDLPLTPKQAEAAATEKKPAAPVPETISEPEKTDTPVELGSPDPC